MYLFSFFPPILMMKKTVKKLTDILASAIWREENDRQIECATAQWCLGKSTVNSKDSHQITALGVRVRVLHNYAFISFKSSESLQRMQIAHTKQYVSFHSRRFCNTVCNVLRAFTFESLAICFCPFPWLVLYSLHTHIPPFRTYIHICVQVLGHIRRTVTISKIESSYLFL